MELDIQLFFDYRNAIINCLTVKAYLGWVLSNINNLPVDDLLPYLEKANKFN